MSGNLTKTPGRIQSRSFRGDSVKYTLAAYVPKLVVLLKEKYY